MKRIIYILITSMLVFALFGCTTMAIKPATPFTLTIIHNNDGESALLANDYSGSVAQFATVVQGLVAHHGKENTLVVSAGDNFLAGPEYRASEGRYDAVALNLAGYEVTAIGNHEFDFGPEGLARFIESAEFTFVSSNLDLSQDPHLGSFVGNKVLPYVILEKGGNSIGIIGATTEQISNISSPGEYVVINEAKKALQETANLLTGKGVKVIISLSHLQNVDEEKELAASISGVDVFVAGGGDNLLGNADDSYLVDDGETDQPEEPYPYETVSPAGEPVLVVATDGSYNYVSRLTVSFDENGLVTGFDDANSGPIGVTPDLPSHPEIEAQVVQPVAAQLKQFDVDIVGSTESGLDGTRSLVRTQESTLGNAITDSYLEAGREYGVDFAFTNGGGIRQNIVIPAGGEMTMTQLLSALPFANYLTVIEGLTAQDVKDIFEHSLAEWPEAAGRFLQVAGIRVEYDGDAAPGNRVRRIVLNHEVVVDNGTVQDVGPFIGLTNSFVAAGGDGYETLANIPADRKTNIGSSYADALEVYFRAHTDRGESLDVVTGDRLVNVGQ